MTEKVKKKDKFKSDNSIFIATRKQVDAHEVRDELKKRMGKYLFPIGTRFYFICGIHHDAPEQIGKTESNLLNFYYVVFSQLKNFCGNLKCDNCNKKIKIEKCTASTPFWNQMKYDCEVVPLFTTKVSDLPNEEENEKYELSELSISDLNKLSRTLCKQIQPSVLVFASCYSYFSSICDILRANGVITALNIMKDRGEIFSGNMFQLDSDQTKMIDHIGRVSLLKVFQLNTFCI